MQNLPDSLLYLESKPELSVAKGGTPHRINEYWEGGTPHILSKQDDNRGDTAHQI